MIPKTFHQPFSWLLAFHVSEFFKARAPLAEVFTFLPAHSTPNPGTALIVSGISQRGFRIHHNRLANELVATAGLVS